MLERPLLLVFYVLCHFQYSACTDFTYTAFGTYTDNLSPAAFGDFNSDELTDLFVIKNIPIINNKNVTWKGQVQILLGSQKEPYFGGDPAKLSCSHDGEVTSVVPGDYDGDGLMDVLTTTNNNGFIESYVHWGDYKGGESSLNCTSKVMLKTMDEPLAITYRTDLRTDLFGIGYGNDGNETGYGIIYRISKSGTPLKTIMRNPTPHTSFNHQMKRPHSHAFLDMNEDNYADLVLTARSNCEVWTYVEDMNSFKLDNDLSFSYPLGDVAMSESDTVEKKEKNRYGQLLFLDLESSDKTYAAMPVLEDPKSSGDSSIHVFSFEFRQWFRLPINFEDDEKRKWSFKYNHTGEKASWMPFAAAQPVDLPPLRYMDVATLRAGDFNNDGFVDLLATLQCGPLIKTFLLENTKCVEEKCELSRTFAIRWSDLGPTNENAVMGVLYDFMQDGILDAIFVQHRYDEQDGGDRYSVAAYKNSLDYDANFLKVMVISGMENASVQPQTSSLLGKKHFLGSNLPGPKIRYRTTNQDGIPQFGRTSQLAQSAHFALQLPYSIFGLGRSPNFVEDLIIGMFNVTKPISPIIPNSQLVIRIPDTAAKDTSKWRAQLFVTPSKIIWLSLFALTGTCMVLAVIIGVLHWKERREDRMERLQESHRGFHFDAM